MVKKSINTQALFGLIPVIAAWLFPLSGEVFFLIISIIFLFLVVGTVPLFRKRENLWMFLLISAAAPPVNIMFSYFIVNEEYFSLGYLLLNVLCVLLFSCIMFSIEQIIFGILARRIWKRQIKIFDN